MPYCGATTDVNRLDIRRAQLQALTGCCLRPLGCYTIERTNALVLLAPKPTGAIE